MVKKITVKPILTDQETKSLEGGFVDLKHYHTIINEDCDAYVTENGERKLLFKFRVGVIPKPLAHKPVEVFSNSLLKVSSSRGVASGKVKKELFSKNVAGFVSPNSFKSRLIYKNGTISDYYKANKVHSMIAGYFDKPKLQDKSTVLKKQQIPCRMTAFSAKNRDKWGEILPLIHKVDRIYARLLPSKYRYQKEYCDKVPDYCIDDTIFTTITVNYNWRTACHVDQGDLRKGYSAITVAEAGDWDGCYLGYPKYGVCVNVREGDLILKDPHQYHCNTEFEKKSKDAKRITVVYYFREGMTSCAF